MCLNVPSRSAAARLLLLACVTHAHTYYTLREEEKCGFGHYGSSVGSAQRMLVRYLKPGVADWNIAVPMPPICKDTQVTGVDVSVCDEDAAPVVHVQSVGSARVHRPGRLRAPAAVRVTVYCVLPRQHVTTTPRLLDRPLYSDEVMSDELITNEVMSDEDTWSESVPNPNGLTSLELMPEPVKSTISSTTSPPSFEDTTPQVELTTPLELTTPSVKISSQSEETSQQAFKVTIKITPSSPKSSKKRKPQTYEVNLPVISNKMKSHEATSNQPPELLLPAAELKDEYPQHGGPATPALSPALLPALSTARPSPLLSTLSPARPPPLSTTLPPARPPPLSPALPPPLSPALSSALLPPLLSMAVRPRVLAPLRPRSLMRPRLSIWQHQNPMIIFRHF